MIESLVQWTLLNNEKVLGLMLGFNIAEIIGQEITTDFGRIDFILSDSQNKQLIVELETTLDNKPKLEYCFNQTLNYKNVRFTDTTDYCILYAEETVDKNKKIIDEFGKANGIIIHTYSLENAKRLYDETVERLSLNVGLALPNPKNYTICFLRSLNKIMKPFLDLGKKVLTSEEIFYPFINRSGSRTNFNCHERIALDFELFKIDGINYLLTDYGELYVKNISPYVYKTTNVPSVNLTNEQKRLLLRVLTNGNWEDKIHKVNIYWFLRFIEVTRGAWIPKKHNFGQEKLDIANGLFNVTYKGRTMCEFLNWCCNYCIELGLIERIKSTSLYDRLTLTPLGIEVNNIFGMDLILKKSRMNLSFKYLE